MMPMNSIPIRRTLVAVAAAYCLTGWPGAAAAQTAATDTHVAIGGVWVISPDAQLRGPDNVSPPAGFSRGRRRRGFGGSDRTFGRTELGNGRGDAGARREALTTFSRVLLNPIRRMTIAVDNGQVEIVFDDGRRLSFETTNKSSDGRAENGLVKLTRKARWDGDALLTEIDIENGPEFRQRYELIAGGAQLRVSTTAEGAPGPDDDGTRTVTHVYERPTEN
jgi:hypothetical protein